MPRRIAVFGGSFDPVHTGHILIAEAARRQYRIDTVLFVPARQSPHKPDAIYAPASDRLAMLRSVVRSRSYFTVGDHELKRRGLSFTIDTLEELRTEFPHARLFLLLGSDNLRSFRAWKDPERIASMVKLIVYKRWEDPVDERARRRWGASLLKGPEVFISSTAIRNRCAHHRTIRYYVPPAVERYIRRHGLYQRRRKTRIS